MIEIENGVHMLPNDVYHSSSGISRSQLMDFKQCPQLYHYKYLSGLYQREDVTDAMVFGELVHTLILEPQAFDERFIVLPEDLKLTTKAGRATRDLLLAENADKHVIKNDVLDIAKAMKLAAYESDDLLHTLVDGAKIEQAIYFTHQPTGLQCKVKPDIWCGAIAADLKTAKDASFRGFQMACVTGGYFVQAGMIHQALRSIGIDMEQFVFYVIEKLPPYLKGVYTLDAEAIDFGVELFHKLMSDLKIALTTGQFNDYGLQTMTVPKWALGDLDG